jgi:hypothetical protein
MSRRSIGPLGTGFVMLIAAAMCMDPDSPSSSPSTSYPASTSSYGASTYSTAAYSAAAEAETRDWLYIHGTLNVRAEPSRTAAVLRTLQRGDFVQLGASDANGWARLYSPGSGEGYVYRASDLVRTRAPVSETVSRAPASSGGGGQRGSSASSRGYHIGPRGGCYTYSASGRKRYVDHSYCN